MAIFTVHVPPGAGDAAEAAEDVLLLREGFLWTAFLVAPVWAVVRGAWRALLVWVVAVAAVAVPGERFGSSAGLVVYIGFALWFGLQAQDFRRRHLAGRGWQFIDIVAAPTAREAEERYFAKLAGDVGPAGLPPMPPPRPQARHRSSAFPPVVGYVSGGGA